MKEEFRSNWVHLCSCHPSYCRGHSATFVCPLHFYYCSGPLVGEWGGGALYIGRACINYLQINGLGH